MQKKIINSIPVLTFSIFDEFQEMGHAVFTKETGTLSLYQGDIEQAKINREKIKHALCLEDIFYVQQIHSKEICSLNTLKSSDGIYTNEIKKPLFIATADCQAAIFYDPIKKVIANIHAGWRGLEQEIYTHTIQTLVQKFQINPANLFVGIAPSISADHFEFKENVPEKFKRFEKKPLHYDLKAYALDELCRQGLLPNHIEVADLCTYKEDKLFYSYRREKTSHRQGALVWLN